MLLMHEVGGFMGVPVTRKRVTAHRPPDCQTDDREEVAHREGLKRRLEKETRIISAIPTKLASG